LLPLVYTNPIARASFVAACLIWLLPEMIAMFPQMARNSRQAALVQDRGSIVILIGLQWIGLALNFALPWFLLSAAIPWQPIVPLVLGIIFILLGVALRWVSIRTLGCYFTRDVAVSADQQVIQEGPYRFIRHPAYTGTFLTMLGVGLAMSNWAGLISLLACIFIGHFYRVSIEEKALVRTLGQPYVDYMRRTRRFIPFLF
jgi:protein-S-isoprenylcysteine O-methyltransferase Ste14